MSELVPVRKEDVPAELSNVPMYDRISNPMDAIKQLGASIFKSGLFGCDRIEQGEILAMQALAERKSPLELARTYHFIQGQLAIRADALLAKYQMAGGKVNWITRTDTEVHAEFYKNPDNKVLIIATMAEYTANGNALKADGKTLKDNWKKWPRRMLTARAISEGVRLIAPECCFGTYTVEELDAPSGYPRRDKSHPAFDSVIPKDLIPAATAKCIALGFLEEGQTLDDLSDDNKNTIARRAALFLQSIS